MLLDNHDVNTLSKQKKFGGKSYKEKISVMVGAFSNNTEMIFWERT